MTRKITKEIAFDLLAIIENKAEVYSQMNAYIKGIQGHDFPTHIKYCDDELLTEILALVDAVLDDNMLAHWYLYDRPRHGGVITVDGKEYVVDDIKTLKEYYYATRSIKR